MRLVHLAGILGLLILFSVACQSESLPTPYPTYTPNPTYTPYPTYTPASVENLPTNRLPSTEIEDLVWPKGSRDDVIPFEEATDFMGEKITVEGTVIRAHNSGSAVFLNFSPDFNAFTAVIFPDDWSKFPSPPENLFYGKLVRVDGVIEEYQGKPEIIIRDPWQIEVALTLGQPILTDCTCPQEAPVSPTTELVDTDQTTPSPEPQKTTTPADKAVVAWEDAADYAGQTVTVTGHIVDTYNSGKVVFLNFDQDYAKTFKVVIFPDAWSRFPGPPEEYYHDKTIQVTGRIEMYQNAPEIIVEQPGQIEILE